MHTNTVNVVEVRPVARFFLAFYKLPKRAFMSATIRIVLVARTDIQKAIFDWRQSVGLLLERLIHGG